MVVAHTTHSQPTTAPAEEVAHSNEHYHGYVIYEQDLGEPTKLGPYFSISKGGNFAKFSRNMYSLLILPILKVIRQKTPRITRNSPKKFPSINLYVVNGLRSVK